MTDTLSEKQRSYVMSRIRSKNTSPEIIVRKLLWGNGFRYRLYSKKLPGTPDIVFAGRKKVIFVHGCFWHKHDCKIFKWPQSHVEFWRNKIERNIARDEANQKALKETGWDVLTVWECETKRKNEEELRQKLIAFLQDR